MEDTGPSQGKGKGAKGKGQSVASVSPLPITHYPFPIDAAVVFPLDFFPRSVPNSAGIPSAWGTAEKDPTKILFGGYRLA